MLNSVSLLGLLALVKRYLDFAIDDLFRLYSSCPDWVFYRQWHHRVSKTEFIVFYEIPTVDLLEEVYLVPCGSVRPLDVRLLVISSLWWTLGEFLVSDSLFGVSLVLWLVFRCPVRHHSWIPASWPLFSWFGLGGLVGSSALFGARGPVSW